MSLRTLDGRPWIVRLGNAWVELFRNIPLLVHIFMWYHVVPSIFPALKSLPGFVLVVLALGFFTSARIAEQVRSGIQALPRGQRYAGMAMGFTTYQYYRYVLLPMAIRIIIPPLTSQYLNLAKNSSLGAAIAFPELVNVFMGTAINQSGRAVEIVALTMAVYLTFSLTTSLFMNWYNSRVALVER
jgi:glutamate/aspartate transport system permease protein